ncbi:MAG TPA: TGS domain-containing protein, partial [Acidimicrobiia bacterium]|nr:TGS domain-containing protein [Acidimicrobiia bacterium]
MSPQITVTLPDGTSREYPRGTTAGDVAASIGKGLAKAALAAKAGDAWIDLSTPLNDDTHLSIITPDTPDGREVLRHSTAHVMAEAVTELFPGAKYAIGPAIADGFYYDFELPDGKTFHESDLAKIENQMRRVVKANQRFVREEVPYDDALQVFADQPYKQEIIEKVRAGDLSEEDAGEAGGSEGGVSLYRNLGKNDDVDFTDLCMGPHVPSTGKLGAFKLTKVAGAYW